LPKTEHNVKPAQEIEEEDQEEGEVTVVEDGDEWTNTEIIITREGVEREWTKWKVRPIGVLDEACVLL
jgi:hypothetical protein